MSDRVLVDTNILTYVHDRNTREKHSAADRFLLTALCLLLLLAIATPARSQPDTPLPAVHVDPTSGIEFVLVRGGTFEMGDVFGDGEEDERPVHTVTVSDFYIGKYEVTQAQWERISGRNPSRFKGAENPVENVTVSNVKEILERFSAKNGVVLRLPTEAEWEYAARGGGRRQKWAGTSDEARLSDYAWYNGSRDEGPRRVGQKLPNELGIYDMTGNVNELVGDWYGPYPEGAEIDPAGPSSGTEVVGRGGAWNYSAAEVRVANRFHAWPLFTCHSCGLRLVMSVARD